MNILFLTRLYDPHIGGVETHVVKITKELIERGHKVTIITEQLPGTEIKQQKSGVTIYRIPVGKDEKKKKGIVWKWMSKNQKLLSSSDIIHCHDVFFWILPFRLTHPFKKIYTTFHGYETVFPIQKKAIMIRKLSEMLSTGTICIGDFIKKWYYARPDLVLYGGVDTVSSVAITKPHRPLRILFIGRLEEDTGVYIYSEALQILSDKGIPFSLTVLGDGRQKESLSRWGEIKGTIKNVGKEIATTDIVFASSYLSILQSLVYKKLIFALYQNALKKDYLNMAPFSDALVIKGDAIQLAHALIAYSADPEGFNSRIDKGYEWVRSNTWTVVTNRYINLWTQ